MRLLTFGLFDERVKLCGNTVLRKARENSKRQRNHCQETKKMKDRSHETKSKCDRRTTVN